MYIEFESLPDIPARDDEGKRIPARFIESPSGPRRPSPVTTKWRNEEILYRECKNLIRVLMKKVDALRTECEQDVHTGSNLPRLLSILKSMHAIVEEPEYEQDMQKQDLMTDNQGLTYIAVRNCDLERFSTK